MKFSDKTDTELAAIIRLGAETKIFKDSLFYTQLLKPQLDKEVEAAKANGDWFPGRTTDCETIAIINAFNSGKQEGLRGIEVSINQLIQYSIEANKEVKFRQEKANK